MHRNRQMSGVPTLDFAVAEVRNSQTKIISNTDDTPRLHGSDRASIVQHITTGRQTSNSAIQTSKGARLDGEKHGQANTLSSMTPVIPSNDKLSILDILQSNIYSRQKRHAGKSKFRRRHRSSRRRHSRYYYWFDSLDSLGSGLIGKWLKKGYSNVHVYSA